MHTIYEGERVSKRSDPVSIPRGKSGYSHDEYARSPVSDQDSSLSGSMQSLSLSRTQSHASSGRRDSMSSDYERDRRQSLASVMFEEDDNKGMFGWANSGPDRREPLISRRDSAGPESAMRRREDGMYGWKDRPLDRPSARMPVDDRAKDRKYSDGYGGDARRRHH